MDPSVGVLAVLLLVLTNGFFVATEFSIVAVRRSRLQQLVAAGKPGALAAREITAHLDTYIAACQLGITMASLGLGWIGEPALAGLIEPPLQGIVHQFAPAAAHGVSVAVAFSLITALHIVIGELAPKGLALQRTEGTVLWVARPMQVFELLFHWPIALLNGVGNGVLRVAGLHPATGEEMVHSVEELRLLVVGSREAGVVEEAEARIATRAFEFADLTAADLMTPRTEVEAVPVTISRQGLLDHARRGRHTRLLVYRDSLDDVVGFLDVRDLVRVALEPPESFDIHALARPVPVTTETRHAHELLEEFRRERRRICLVVDEFGGTAGLITVEDLVEPLVGRIEPEPSRGASPALQAGVDPRVEADGSISFEGLTRLDEFEEASGVRLEQLPDPEVKTVGGLVMAALDRIPEVGDEVAVEGRTLRVEELDGRRVARVRLLP